MLYDDILLPTQNNIKFYLGKVTEIDENYVIKFKIPNILENGISVFPTAYPITGQHVQEIVEDDSVLIIQPDDSIHFFFYSPINLSNFTGLFFKNVKVDISDGVKIALETEKCKTILDGDSDSISLETSGGVKALLDGNGGIAKLETKQYSLGQFIEDLDNALKNFHSEGSPASHTAQPWYGTSVAQFIAKAKMAFPK